MQRVAAGILLYACGFEEPRSVTAPARFLYAWAGDKDEQDSDFLAVFDLRTGSSTYGEVLWTDTVGLRGSMPHHLEYSLPAPDQFLFGNSHHHEAVLLFAIREAARPRLARKLGPIPPLRFPHDFLRLPDGTLLIGFLRSDGPSPLPGDSTLPGGHGGIAQVDPDGRIVRVVSAADSAAKAPIRPYAFAVLPGVDRLVSTSAAMMESHSADVVQVWRLSDLRLLHTLNVPEAHLADGRVLRKSNALPFEPRVLPDGRSVFFNSYGCGLYHLTEVETPRPRVSAVHAIDTPDETRACGVPVVVGHFWLMPVGRAHSLVTLDISDPGHPVEVSRLVADTAFRPHWLAKDPGSDRLIVGAEGGGEDRMLLAHVDSVSGKLRWDETLRGPGGREISFRRHEWPHGLTGEAFGHAALFRP